MPAQTVTVTRIIPLQRSFSIFVMSQKIVFSRALEPTYFSEYKSFASYFKCDITRENNA